jgi:hypothetical protein
MAVDPQALADAAKCFICLTDPILVKAMVVRLLCAVRDGETIDTDPQSLADASACIACSFTAEQLDQIMIPILVDILNA